MPPTRLTGERNLALILRNGARTVRVIEPLTPPKVAVTTDVPAEMPAATLPFTVAAEPEEDQRATPVKSCVLPSL